MLTVNAKSNNLKIQVPKGKAFAYETTPDMMKLHQNMLIVGARGSGKTVCAVNVLRMLPFDRIFCISPTMKSNQEIMKTLKINPEDVYENPDDISCMTKIREAIEKEAQDLDQYIEDMKEYTKFQKKKSNQNPLTTMRQTVLKKPEHKYNGRKPICALLCDDIMGSMLFSGKGIRLCNQMCIFHRHIGQLKNGGAIGISLFWLLQSYLSQSGGISKCIRNNATSLVLFKTKSEKQLEEIASECAGEVSKEDFNRVYEHAIDEPHSFLFIDFFKKESQPSMFRKRFTEYILI